MSDVYYFFAYLTHKSMNPNFCNLTTDYQHGENKCAGHFVSAKRLMNFKINLLNYRGLRGCYIKFFSRQWMSPKWHPPTLSKTKWYEFENSKPNKNIKNKIIDRIWSFDMIWWWHNKMVVAQYIGGTYVKTK